MIIKASQRGGAPQLAKHLLNANDNDHVELGYIHGFASKNVIGALQETYIASRGTRCKQFMFSVSLSPPIGEEVTHEIFENAARRVAESVGLEKQPRVLVYHEKKGRRHAHLVISRIDATTMTSKNLDYYKKRLMEVSKELYLENGWELPRGHINSQNTNPLNMTREQIQQAKRLGESAKNIKMTFKECWSISKDKASFRAALEKRGYYLAQGDRRGFVAVDWKGDAYAVAKWLDLKSRDLKPKLGECTDLPSINETKQKIDQLLVERMRAHLRELEISHRKKMHSVLLNKTAMQQRHRLARANLKQAQEKRWKEENIVRQSRYRKGIGGLWDRVCGKASGIRKQNEMEAYVAVKRDRGECDALALGQVKERAVLQRNITARNNALEKDKKSLQEAIFSRISPEQITKLQNIFQEQAKHHSMQPRLSM